MIQFSFVRICLRLTAKEPNTHYVLTKSYYCLSFLLIFTKLGDDISWNTNCQSRWLSQVSVCVRLWRLCLHLLWVLNSQLEWYLGLRERETVCIRLLLMQRDSNVCTFRCINNLCAHSHVHLYTGTVIKALRLKVMCLMEAYMPSISSTCIHLLSLHHLLVFLKVWWLGGAPKCLTSCQKITETL